MPLACFSARNFVIREREKRLKSKGTTAVYGAPPIFWVILSDLNVMIRDIHFWKGYGPWISKHAFLKSYLSVLAQEASDKAGEHGDPPLPWVRVILR